ncbi:hypothetical protein [Streptomyces sp. NRRL S-118]|uniref:hypothetical protein n=1 Tax=Streptomyces sp. NRRL S-118 TaxID=1463881 RepID=UPI0004C5FF34|nr:hypothetical protein [Streptomyces sp. NRRL S-118]
MGDQAESFADLAHRLAQALDAWQACVGEPTAQGRPTRKALVAALEAERRTSGRQSRKKIDEALLSYWLKGREQLLPGTKHNRLPSEEDCDALARALAEKAPRSARQLPRIGREIAHLARDLRDVGGPGWRNRVLTSITVPPVERAEPPGQPGPTDQAAPVETAEPVTGRRRYRNHRWLWAGAASAVVAAGSAGAFMWPDGGESASAGKPPDARAAPSAQGPGVSVPGRTASRGPGGVQGDHRCGKARSAGAVSWTPCTLAAEDGTMSFLVQLTNTSARPVTVRAKLAYVQAAVEQTCPGPWGTSATVTVGAGATRTSPLDACAVAPAPAQAYQARVWVVPDGSPRWGYREHSPTLHVQADGTPVWADEA